MQKKEPNRSDEEIFCLEIKRAILAYNKYKKKHNVRESNCIELYDGYSWTHLGSVNREHLIKAKKENPKYFKHLKDL